MFHTIARAAIALSLTVALSTQSLAKCAGKSILPEFTKSHPEAMAAVRKRAKEIPNANAILWRVSKAGLAPSHLFGTMHISDERIINMPKQATDALQSAKLVALEIADLSPTAMMQTITKQPQLMVYTDGSRLDKKLTEANFKKAAALLSKSGIPAQMAAVIRPWLVSVMLALPDCERAKMAKGEKALDLRIGETAKANKTPLVGLETIESQLKSMANISEEDQIGMLRGALAFMDRREDLFETLIQSYINRDLGMILALSEGTSKMTGIKNSGFSGFSRELIVKRNFKMFDASVPLIDQGNAFVAVGAAHLIGKTGLVALYRKAGFKVDPIN